MYCSCQPGGQFIPVQLSERIINQRAARIDEIYLSNLQTQLNEYLTDLSDLAVLCSSDTEVSHSLSPSASRLDALDAQERLDTYLATSSIQKSIDVISVVNAQG